MTTSDSPRTLIDSENGTRDGRTLTLDTQIAMTSRTEIVFVEEAMPPITGEESLVVEVDPLMCFPSAPASVPAYETVRNDGSAPLVGLVPSSSAATLVPCEDFMSAVESSPSVSGLGRIGSRTRRADDDVGYEVDRDEDSEIKTSPKSKKVVGRKRAVVAEDSDVQSSMSVTSAYEDESMTASSSKKKGVKRGREMEKEKDQGKEGKSEEKSSVERKKKRKIKKKESGKKDTPEEEMEGKSGEPKGIVDPVLEDLSSSVLSGAILEWINRIDEIRVKSKNFQGRLSGEMKRCVNQIKEGTILLAARSEATGDPQFLRMRNSELVTQLREVQRDNARLKEQLRKVSPGPSSPLRKKKIERATEKAADTARSNLASRAAPSGVKVVPPLSGEAFPPLPQRLPRNMVAKDGANPASPEVQALPLSLAICDSDDSGSGTEALLTQRIKLLTTARDLEKERKERIRRGSQGLEQLEQAGSWERRKDGNREMQEGVKRVGPRILSNIQVAPPFKEHPKDRAALAASETEEEWKVVGGGRQRRGHRSDRTPVSLPPAVVLDSSSAARKDRGMRTPGDRVNRRPPPSRQQLRLRPPRPPVSSAVTITGRSEGFSYATALKSARENINLEALGIRTSRVRKTVNGGLLIEISGEDSKVKAEELVTQLRNVLQDSAAVACPTKKRELRIVGFDESVTTSEIAGALADLGGCSIMDVRIGSIRTMSNGLGMVWAQLPVSAAAKVTSEGRIRIGWTVARVELLKVRPLQCFRCWSFGHVQNLCRSVVDRRGACFKCGQQGHMANVCRNLAHCVVCHDSGFEAAHRLGGPQCASQVRQDALTSDRRSVKVRNNDNA